jgi:hypothetical protein
MNRLALFFLLTLSARAELRLITDFEGGNAEVVSLDQATRTLRIMPALREDRGWPCWWFFKLDGLTAGEEFTLEVQAQTKPYREKTVLAAAWCQPKHAWISSDGQTWNPSDKGTLSADKAMVYKIKADAVQMSMAWGPPLVPSDADKLLADIAVKLPEVKRFELAKTRGGRPVQGIRIGAETRRIRFGSALANMPGKQAAARSGVVSSPGMPAMKPRTCVLRPACITSRSWTWTTPPSALVARRPCRVITIATGPPSRSIPRWRQRRK